MLKRAGNVNLVVSIVSIVVYISISTFMIWESRKTLSQTRGPSASSKGAKAKDDPSAFKHVTSRIQRFKIWPMVKLPSSGVTISLWIILWSRSSADFSADFLAAAPVTFGCRQWFMSLEFPL